MQTVYELFESRFNNKAMTQDSQRRQRLIHEVASKKVSQREASELAKRCRNRSHSDSQRAVVDNTPQFRVNSWPLHKRNSIDSTDELSHALCV